MRNLDTIVTFYATTAAGDSYAQQNRFKEYVEKDIPLICFTDTLLPFIIRRPHNSGTTSALTWKLKYYETGAEVTMDASTLIIQSGTVYDYIIYPISTATIPAGKFFHEITDSHPSPDLVYYSETHEAKPAGAKEWYTEIMFINLSGINSVPGKIWQMVYIDNIFKCPEFIRKDTGDEVDGLIVFEKMIIQPILVLRGMLIPEYLVHALMYMPAFDYVRVKEFDGSIWYPQAMKIKDPEWIEATGGGDAKLEMQFTVKTIVKKLTFMEGEEMAVITTGRQVEPKTVSILAETDTTITWDNPFEDADYTVTLTAFDANGNPVFPTIKGQTKNDILVWARKACTCRAIAAK